MGMAALCGSQYTVGAEQSHGGDHEPVTVVTDDLPNSLCAEDDP
jgi:hypothetical protein